ncbi:DNA cytosine methyltransferase [Anabaena sp. UHCC 0253]|uniref:DNA cytosine methyltransferase n=1 Tax=Anabaena sp. UHCC 0253 TaxID=2590019 RepID=UPI001445AA2A|nr:DNA cytosine methyltransferase [Anabaena sp. UHCC 0253]MTJ53621.1 DNA cytosine methyltransferase [Anabaena sp. UHCC 0253]
MNNKIIDLFSGAGGLTTGFHLAGFEALCAIDANKKALATYQHNYPNTKVIHQDIREVNPSELRHNLGLEREQLQAIIGGPPCQGFSRNIPAEYRYIDDPQNQLYKSFLDFVKEFKPLYVIMENVPEILTAYKGLFKYQITNQLESLGYKVTSSSLNAAKYGVPQTRSRAFFVASLERLIVLPNPTHNDDIKINSKNQESYYQTNLLKSNSSPIVTVKDAIGDLPELNAGQKYDEDRYPSDPQTSYQTLIRHNSSKITNHIARALSSIQMSRVKLLKEGQDARDLPPELAPKKHYSGAYGRLYWDQPAKTITRWVFHPGSGRFFHPTQNRTITIREAARLHSYPDTFHFLGTYTEMASQIGESVPPLLAKTIAECIL